ncbi:hypothetical protein LS73_002375 [Helicobacter muridarum]|uniref:Lipoprotein n=1 Tax=Helicobacter muridarum TaxID=216 RepID=A0A099TXT5_9HELI|nr:hypothetical protein [Helicobacter muridarum]TLE01140.1 hypothetical protein LS73_002375 [Helicobacter muridarum]STQ86009.1 Uncharacterised protein [Helicobacter muridarum]
MKNINSFRSTFCIIIFLIMLGFSGCAKNEAKGSFVGKRCDTVCNGDKCKQSCTNIKGKIR